MYYLQTLFHYGVAPEVNSGSSPAQPLGVGAAEELLCSSHPTALRVGELAFRHSL